MRKLIRLNKAVTMAIGVCLFSGAVIIWKAREKKINQEIDEFDRIMQELKADKVEQYDYYKKEACERKEVTRCCQIR